MKLRLNIIAIAVGIFCLGAFGGMWAQAFLLPYVASQPPFQEWQFVRDWADRTTRITEVREVVIRLDDAAERVASRAESIAVAVESRGAGLTIRGSGFIAASDGFILTQARAVPQGYEVRVYLQDAAEFAQAEVLKRDAQQDLAILKIDPRNLPTAGFANADSVRLGASVVMIAKSLEAGELVTIVNQGTVRTKSESAIRTNVFDKNAIGGAPLFDLEGRIVGLSAFEPDGRLVAIPSSALRAFSGF